jgi:hypothetical protein
MDIDVGMGFAEEVVEGFEVRADEIVGEDVDGLVGQQIGRVGSGRWDGVGDVVGEFRLLGWRAGNVERDKGNDECNRGFLRCAAE